MGYARKDGENGAEAVRQYLETISPPQNSVNLLNALQERLVNLSHPVVDKAQIMRLDEIERDEAESRGLEDFKFASNEEMLKALNGKTELVLA